MADSAARALLPGDDQADDPLRVLAVVDHWSSARGGVGTFNRRLCKALAAAGAEVSCLVQESEPGDKDDAEAAGVLLLTESRPDSEPAGRRFLLPPDMFLNLPPDVILGHGQVTGWQAQTLRERFFRKATCVHFVHTDPDELEWQRDPEEDPLGELAERKWKAEVDLMQHADRVLAVGPRLFQSARQALKSFGDLAALHRIDPGFDLSGPPPEPPDAEQLLQVLVLGRLGARRAKGLDIAARAVGEAIRLLGEDGERVKLFLCGAETSEKHNSRKLREAVQRWSGRKNLPVTVHPFTTDDRTLQGHLQNSALVLMPSRAEGFGLVGLEAIAAGVPVLITARSGLAKVLQDAEKAIALPVEDVPASDRVVWGRAIADILRDPRSAFARAAELREKMRAEKTWSAAAQGLLEVVPGRHRTPGGRPQPDFLNAFVCRTGSTGLAFESRLQRAAFNNQIERVALYTCVNPEEEHLTTAAAMAKVIRRADVVLFVLTVESSRDTRANPCLSLLELARDQGKPIVVLQVDYATRPPIDLPDRPTIDFTGEFASGLGDLAAHLARLGRAPHHPTPPARTVPAATQTGSGHEFVAINDMPDILATDFQDRGPQRRALKELLSRSGFRLIQLEGDNGIGKTALLRTMRVEEERRSASACLDAFVYFSARGFRWITVATLLEDLVRTGDPNTTSDLVGAIRTTPWRALLNEVVAALARRRIAVVIDDADELFDARGTWKDRELAELLTGLADRDDHEVKVVMSVKRVREDRPDDARLMRHTERISLNGGLAAGFAKPLLAGLDVDGHLADTPDAQLARLLSRTAGHPRALELVAGILHKHPGESADTLSDLLEHAPEPAATLFEFLFARLDLHERRVAQALAVFARPVPPEAVTYLLNDVAKNLQTELVLRSLRACFLIHNYGDRYYLPSADADFVLSSLLTAADAGGANALAKETMWLRGAEYFQGRQAASPDRIEDLWPQFGEIELCHRAGRWVHALRVMNDVDDRYLSRWGQSHVLVSWRNDLRTKLGTDELKGLNLSRLVGARRQYEGHSDDNLADIKAAFGHAEAIDDRSNAVVVRVQLANALADRGDFAEAEIQFREATAEALTWGEVREEANARAGRASCLVRSGDFAAAQDEVGAAFRAVATWYQAGPDRDEIWAHLLVTRAWVARQRGDHWLGRRLLDIARDLASQLGSELLLGRVLGGLAANALVTDQAQRAVELTVQSARIGVRLDNGGLLRESAVTRSLALLELDDRRAAAEAADIGARYATTPRAFDALCAQGLVAYRQRDDAKAGDCFTEAMNLLPPQEERPHRDYLLLDAKGTVLCGLALLNRRPIADAVGAFHLARRITAEPGVLAYNDLVLRQFGERADSEILAQAQLAACGERYGGLAALRQLRP